MKLTDHDNQVLEWFTATGYENLEAVRADLLVQDDVIRFIDSVLQGEPNHVTHSMSIWNQARRIKVRLERKKYISSAMSYDQQTDSWRI